MVLNLLADELMCNYDIHNTNWRLSVKTLIVVANRSIAY
jgi:hypothetical protein